MNRRNLFKTLGGAAIIAMPLPAIPAPQVNKFLDPACALPVNSPGFWFARLFVQRIDANTGKALGANLPVGDYCHEGDHCPNIYKDPDAMETADSAIIRFRNPFVSGVWGKPNPRVTLRLSFLVHYRDGSGHVAHSWLGNHTRYHDL